MIVKQHKDRLKVRYSGASYHQAENFLPGWFSTQLCPQHLQQHHDSLIQLQSCLQGTNTVSGHMQGIDNGINALGWLLNIVPLPLPAGVTIQPCGQFTTDGLSYGNVLVKARPNALIIRPKNGNVQAKVGALKFHFSKSTTLSDPAGDLASVALYEYLNQCSGLPFPALHSLCYSIDACRSSIRTAPASHIKIHQELVDACEQYEMIWNSL